MTGITRRLADFVAGTSCDALPNAVVARLRLTRPDRVMSAADRRPIAASP